MKLGLENRYVPVESLNSQHGSSEIKQCDLWDFNAAFLSGFHAKEFQADELFDGACFENVGTRSKSMRLKPFSRHRAITGHACQADFALRASKGKP